MTIRLREVYQKDFYQMAAFMGGVETRGGGGGNMMMGGGDSKAELARMNKLLKDGGKLRERDTTDRRIGQMLGTHRMNVNDTGRNVVKLPHDYHYDNGEPNGAVEPKAYLGDIVDVEKYETTA